MLCDDPAMRPFAKLPWTLACVTLAVGAGSDQGDAAEEG